MGKKFNIKFIHAEFEKEGYILLTEVYENNKQKLEYICSSPERHKHSITWDNWKQGKRCPYCNGNAKLTIEYIRAEFAKEGYILLTEIYENNAQKLEYICSRSHCHSIAWSDWNSKRKQRCPYCANKAKLTIDFICAEFAKEGYILLTTKYEGAHQKLKYICPRGHRHSISWSNWQQNKRCPERSNRISKWEKAVKIFLSKSDIDHVPNDKSQLINPNTGCRLELDIWIPKLNKAIECNGLYWHCKKRASKNDKIKKQLCKDQRIDLLVITDKEWKKDIDKCKRKLISFVKAGT